MSDRTPPIITARAGMVLCVIGAFLVIFTGLIVSAFETVHPITWSLMVLIYMSFVVALIHRIHLDAGKRRGLQTDVAVESDKGGSHA